MAIYSSCCLIFLTLEWERLYVLATASLDVEKHLSLGIELTARGQFADALSHFHAAVEGDPDNYLTYFRRATVYLALGKSKSALPDLDAVIKLKPDFTAAWLQRGSILLKQGRLDEAHINFEAVLRHEPDNEDALNYYSMIEPIKQDLQMAQILIEEHNYEGAVAALSKVIEVCPWDASLRESRAECHINAGHVMEAMWDLRSITKLRGDSTRAHYQLSTLHYQAGEAEESLGEIRECLKLDPDHKECFVHYKKVKKVAASLKTAHEQLNEKLYEECIEKAHAILKLEKEIQAYQLAAKALLCQCLSGAGRPTEALKSCTEALEIEESDINLCHRAEAHIANEDYEEALNDYQKASQLDGNSQCAQQGIPHAQKLVKQSKRRDYYKILGVKRTATKREITKAYRKLAQQWHPDQFSESEKKMAEKKFIDIAAAKEVLTDPEKRQKFDSGDDPLDPESQAGRGFNPFAQGFHPFQGGGGGGGDGPFQFRFHFN